MEKEKSMLEKLKEHFDNTPIEELQKSWDEVVKQSEGVESPNAIEYIGFLNKNYPIHNVMDKEDLFDKEFIESLGYKVTRDDGVYGEAQSIRPKGKRIMQWNREGRKMNYFGEPIEYGAYFGIREDGDTRTVFNGIVRTKEQIKLLDSLTF